MRSRSSGRLQRRNPNRSRVSRNGWGPGTPSVWETPPPARLPHRLVIKDGFRVDGGHHHQLDEQAKRLGFADLRACLLALLEDAWSIPQLSTHLDTTQAVIRRAITDYHVHPLPRREQLAHQRAADRAAKLGFHSVQAYLVDRLAAQAWTLQEVAAELGAARGTLRRLLDHHQVRRVAPTQRQRAAAAAASGPRQPARAAQRRQARLAERGFTGLEEYLQDRYVGRGWSVRRLGAELGVSHGWLDQQLT